MTRQDFENKTLNELCEELEEQGQITSFEALKQFAIENINKGYFFLTKHLCDSLGEESDYYIYDYSMGTLETPTSITSKEDIEHLIED